MVHEIALTKLNRIKLALAFRHNRRVDLAIDCAVEGQMGRAFTDNPEHPTAYCIVSGPFRYYAGEADKVGGRHMLGQLPAHNLLMPSPAPWTAVAQEIYGEQLETYLRYQFSSAGLSTTHLADLLQRSKYCSRIVGIDGPLAAQLSKGISGGYDISNFDSSEDFATRGIGFAAMDRGKAMGVAYSSLVCSKGIEVSIYVQEPYRERGLATALAAQLLLACLEHGINPHWDAANPASYKLARRLGYDFEAMYEAYFCSTE